MPRTSKKVVALKPAVVPQVSRPAHVQSVEERLWDLKRTLALAARLALIESESLDEDLVDSDVQSDSKEAVWLAVQHAHRSIGELINALDASVMNLPVVPRREREEERA